MNLSLRQLKQIEKQSEIKDISLCATLRVNSVLRHNGVHEHIKVRCAHCQMHIVNTLRGYSSANARNLRTFP